jgi:hypothetical protein
MRAVEVAGGQWANITTAQLRAIGFSKSAIHWMVKRSGRRRGDATLRVRTAKRRDVANKRGLQVTTPAQTSSTSPPPVGRSTA